MQLRPAAAHDLEAIVALCNQARDRRAEWAPTYFRPHENADELHPMFLEFMVGSADHVTSVLVDGDATVGFFVRIDQPRRVWLDDLVVADETYWPSVLELILGTEAERWVTCVAALDTEQLSAMATAGLAHVSSYFARLVNSGGAASFQAANEPIDDEPDRAALHTFGGNPFSPATEGALVISDGDGGYLVGSQSYTPPPVYDPGGPTTVVDRVIGANRRGLIESACSAAADRGDAQLVVVSDAADHELERLLVDLRFERVVDLMGSHA